MPKINNILLKLNEGKYISQIDLTMGYHAIKIKEECRHLFTFVTTFGKFQYCRMLFRDAEAPDIFSHLMHKIFYDLTFVLTYLDNILVISSTPEQHTQYLEVVLSRLEE